MIKLRDEKGRFIYSQMYGVEGDKINITESEEKATLWGAPRFVTLELEPHMFCENPSRPLDPSKRYRVIVIEAEEVEVS